MPRRADFVSTRAELVGVGLGRVAGDVLLDDLDVLGADFGDDGDVAEVSVSKDEEVIGSGRLVVPVVELEQIAGGVALSVWDFGVEKITRVAPDIGHFMLEGVVVITFDELDALPFLAVVVALGGVVFAVAGGDDEAVLIGGHAAVAGEDGADGTGHGTERAVGANGEEEKREQG